MKKIVLFLIVATTLMSAGVNAQPPLHIVWDKSPISVILPVGTERMVSFSSSVKFGFDASSLPADTLRVQNVGGTLYLLAKKAFQAVRVQVLLNDSGQIVLLNLSATAQADSTPLAIVLPSIEQQAVTSTTTPSISFDAVTLTRFAFQQLYAPERLLTQPVGISRVAMRVPKVVTLIDPSELIAMPLIGWRGGEQYVTAILLRNQTKNTIALDSAQLCGDFVSSSFYPKQILSAQGTLGDSTTLIVVTSTPIATALNRCILNEEAV